MNTVSNMWWLPTGGKTGVQVPFRLLKNFHKVQTRLVRELEKKFSGKDVVIIGNRKIMSPPKTGYALARPRSRTLTSVCVTHVRSPLWFCISTGIQHFLLNMRVVISTHVHRPIVHFRKALCLPSWSLFPLWHLVLICSKLFVTHWSLTCVFMCGCDPT